MTAQNSSPIAADSAANLDIVILAAGKGTRMRSAKAKVLHEIAGQPMLGHVLEVAQQLNPRNIAVVVGHQADKVKSSFPDDLLWVDQTEQLGTGHAVKLAMQQLPDDGLVLVLYGDVPLVSLETLSAAVAAAESSHVGLVTAVFDDPAELGRIVRNDTDAIQKIVEFKDADAATRQIDEINSGIVAAPTAKLKPWLTAIKPNNKQGEYYLTDIIAMAVNDDVDVVGVKALIPEEVTGVNDRLQLAELERVYQRQQANILMQAGVTLADPERLDIRGEISVGQDSFIDINVVLQGKVSLGEGVRIGPGAVIIDSQLGDNCEVKAHTVVEGADLKADVAVGPFARIRPGSILESGVRIGNFVETKKSHIGERTKAGHLAYLGDATIGADCNIGAGAVTCNYDGINKHQTHIGDDVFVGTNTTLVAPIEMQDSAFIAAGSTVTTRVDSGDLAVGRAKQRNIKGWARPDSRPSRTKENTKK